MSSGNSLLSTLKRGFIIASRTKNILYPAELKQTVFATIRHHYSLYAENHSSVLPLNVVRHFSSDNEQQSLLKMSKTALVIIANGSEEIEAVTPIDTLRRAGVDVTVAGLQGAGNTVMSRNVIVGAEKSLEEALKSAPFDVIILPGGLKGAESFAESAEIGRILKDQEKAGRLVAAICAAPTALHKHDICVGKAITSYPTVKDKMTVDGKYNYKEDRVVVDGNLITSRGPGTALEFSLAITASLVGQEKADEVGKGMLVKL